MMHLSFVLVMTAGSTPCMPWARRRPAQAGIHGHRRRGRSDPPLVKPGQTKVGSTFRHDEFLVYDEAQVRIRYVLTVKL